MKESVTFSFAGFLCSSVEIIKVLLAAVLQLVSVKPGSQEIRPVCGGRFLTPLCLQTDHQTDAQTPIAAEGRRRDGFYINSDRVALFF